MALTKATYRMTKDAFINVKDFGAVGDASTDDTSAFQAAINEAQANPQKTLFIPKNEASDYYKITSPIVITGSIKIQGENTYQTNIWGHGMSAGEFVIDIDGPNGGGGNLNYVEIDGLTLGSTDGVPNLLHVNQTSISRFSNIFLRDAVDGIVLTGTRNFSNIFDRVQFIKDITGTSVKFDSNYNGGGHFTFINCNFGGNIGMSVDAGAEVEGMSIYSCNFEATTNEAFRGYGSIFGLQISGCRFEKNGGNSDIDLRVSNSGQKVVGVDISGNYFETDANTHAITLGGGSGQCAAININGNYAQDYSTAFVQFNGGGESGQISSNYLQNTPAATSGTRSPVAIFNNRTASGSIDPEFEIIEGSWTPAFVPETNSFGAITYDGATGGTYTKIGRVVYFQGYLETDSITVGTATGDVTISGLPYTSQNVNYQEAAISIGTSDTFTGDVPSSGYVIHNTTTIQPTYRATSNGNTVNLAVADLNTSAGNKIRFSGFYTV